MANNLQPSQSLLDFMTNYEQFRADAYANKIAGPNGVTTDVPTIGYGHTGPDVYIGMPPISKSEAQILFNQDLKGVVQVINRIQAPLSQNQFDALVDLAFNAGPGLFQVGSRSATSILSEINEGDFSNVPEKMAQYVFSNGVVAPGPIQRRYDDVNIFDNGIYARSYNHQKGDIPVTENPLPDATVSASTAPIVGSAPVLSSGGFFNSSVPAIVDQLPSAGQDGLDQTGLNQTAGNSGSSVGFATPEMEQAIFGNTSAGNSNPNATSAINAASVSYASDQNNSGPYGDLSNANVFGNVASSPYGGLPDASAIATSNLQASPNFQNLQGALDFTGTAVLGTDPSILGTAAPSGFVPNSSVMLDTGFNVITADNSGAAAAQQAAILQAAADAQTAQAAAEAAQAVAAQQAAADAAQAALQQAAVALQAKGIEGKMSDIDLVDAVDDYRSADSEVANATARNATKQAESLTRQKTLWIG